MSEYDFFKLIRQDDGKSEVVLPGYVQRVRCVNRINWQDNKTQAGLNPRQFLGYFPREVEVLLELIGDNEEEINQSMARLYEIYFQRDESTLKPWVYEPRFPDLVAQQVRRIVFDKLEPVYGSGEPTSRQMSVKLIEEDGIPALNNAQKASVQIAKPHKAESGSKYPANVLRDSKFRNVSFTSAVKIAIGEANTAAKEAGNKEIKLDDREPQL